MPETRTVSLEDVLRDCHAAIQVMSVHNPHRRVIETCAEVLIQQATMIIQLKTALAEAPPAASGVLLTDG